MVATASSGATTVVVKEDGAQGLSGVDGTDGAGFNQVRQSKLDNPLSHLFKTNQLSLVSAPLNTDADVTWTRASIGTFEDRYGIVQTAAIDVPREEKEGFLIEGASTNILLHSEDITNVVWTLVGTATRVGNSTVGPDDNTTADTVNVPANNDLVRQNTSFDVANKTITASVWVKGTQGEEMAFEITNAVDSNQVVEHVFSGDWERITNTHTFSSTTANIRFQFAKFSFTDATSWFVWGSMIEELPFASSYITTTTASVTRSADLVSAVILNNIALLSSAFAFSFSIEMFGATGGNQVIIGLNTISGGLSDGVFVSGAGTSNFRNGDGLAAGISITDQVERTFVALFDGADLQIFLNGSTSGSASTVSAPDVLDLTDVFTIGSDVSLGSNAYMHIKDLRAYDFDLNADEITYLSGI